MKGRCETCVSGSLGLKNAPGPPGIKSTADLCETGFSMALEWHGARLALWSAAKDCTPL
ncbi:MAG: hypothetical protein ACOX4Q_04885 [Syntrophomonadales bacterium]